MGVEVDEGNEGERHTQTHSHTNEVSAPTTRGGKQARERSTRPDGTEKIGMRDFLSRRRVPGYPDARFDCGSRRQTVAHILLDCRNQRDLRRQELGRFPGRNNLRVILNTRKLATKAIRFIEQTRICGSYVIQISS